jgi:hypothetical protein
MRDIQTGSRTLKNEIVHYLTCAGSDRRSIDRHQSCAGCTSGVAPKLSPAARLRCQFLADGSGRISDLVD